MNLLQMFGQRSCLRVSGLRKLTARRLSGFLAAVAAVVITLTEGVVDAFAAEANYMSKNSVVAETDGTRFFRASEGVLVEDLAGEVFEEQNANVAYNPASGVKVLTAYATLKHFGPNFQFETSVLLDGNIAGGTFCGDIFLYGSDPFFDRESLKEVFQELKNRGVDKVDGALFVSGDFKYSGNASGSRSAGALKKVFARRLRRAKTVSISGVSVRVASVKVKEHSSSAPEKLSFLIPDKLSWTWPEESSTLSPTSPSSSFSSPSFKVQSPTVLALLKDMLSRSDNDMAATFGNLLGGPQAIAKICRADFALTPEMLSIQTSSGLGINRVSPKAMMAALRGFKRLLGDFNLELEDALPVAGIDRGTIFNRFAESKLKGVLVGKTGTLKETDRGACVLVGEMRTLSRGEVLFVVFQRGRNTTQLRLSQNNFLEDLLLDSGGPGFKYAG